jgi:hypothetical protein
MRWWRWVLTCLLLTFVAPAPASAQLEDGISWQAEASPATPTASRAAAPAIAGAAALDALPPEAPACALERPALARLYLLNCALLR